jgi:aminoglycoside 3-N-acetyltransferase I
VQYRLKRLTPADLAQARALLTVFEEAFDEPETYRRAPPSDEYLARILAQPHVVVLLALGPDDADAVVGGLLAYQLDKLEQARSEFYIYDLAVHQAHRRQRIATRLIRELGSIAKERGAWVMFVQADLTDPPAIALYESLGTREDVLHFDIAVD